MMIFIKYIKDKLILWRPEEVDLSKDLNDWSSLNDNEKTFYKYGMAFFAASVNSNGEFKYKFL